MLIAAADAGAAWLNQGRSLLVENITNFIGSVPVFLFWSSYVPEILSIALFFLYWTAVGAGLVWLAGKKGRFFKFSALILLAALGVSHRSAQGKLERDMEEAVRAAGGHGFTRPAKP